MNIFLTFIELLDNHDYSFDFSDDGSVFRRGMSQRGVINDMANQYPVLVPIYKLYYNYWWNNNPTTRAVHLLYRDRAVAEYINQQQIPAVN